VGIERVVELLKAIGMSGYEAKAYVALVRAGQPLNGYEVAKASGVPRSTVYETLGKLVVRGAAFEVNVPEQGMAYLALPAETLIGRLRRELADTIDHLADSLPALASPSDAHLVQHVHGAAGVLARATDVIEGAQASLFLSVWPDDLAVFLPALRRAHERGVDLSCITFGEVDEELAGLGHVHEHRFSSPDVVLTRLGYRVFTVVADRDAVLIGGADGHGMWGMWSDDPAVVMVAAEYVRHDIALQVIVGHAGGSALEHVWNSDPELEHLRASAGVPDSVRPR
jgi:HTH-type transcriptional regulator, sugar sensing transcriptional regulator